MKMMMFCGGSVLRFVRRSLSVGGGICVVGCLALGADALATDMYTLTLDDTIVDGVVGEGGQGSVTVTFDAALPPLTSIPSKTGYTFLGYGSAVMNFSTGAYSPEFYYDEHGEPVGGKKYDSLSIDKLYSVWVKNVAVPVGKTLTYNGALQTGVDESSEGDYTLSWHQQTSVGGYWTIATLVQPVVTEKLGLVERKWGGGTTSAKDVLWSITAKTLTFKRFEVSFDDGANWQTISADNPADIGYGANTPKYRAVYATGVTGEADKYIDVTSLCSGSYKRGDKPNENTVNHTWDARPFTATATGRPDSDDPNYSVPELSNTTVGTVSLHANTYTWKGEDGRWGDSNMWTLEYATPGCPAFPDDDSVAPGTDGKAVSKVNFAGKTVVVTVDDKDYSFATYVDDASSDVTFTGTTTVLCKNEQVLLMPVRGKLTVVGVGTDPTQRTTPTLWTTNHGVKLFNGATLVMRNLNQNVSATTIDLAEVGTPCVTIENCAFTVSSSKQMFWIGAVGDGHFNVTMTNSTITSSSSSGAEQIGSGAEIKLVDSIWTADYISQGYSGLVIDLEDSKLLLGRENTDCQLSVASTKISGVESRLEVNDGSNGCRLSFSGTFDITYPSDGSGPAVPISAYNGVRMDSLSTVNITAIGCALGCYPLIRAQTTDVSLPMVTPTITVNDGLVGRLEKSPENNGVDLVIATNPTLVPYRAWNETTRQMEDRVCADYIVVTEDTATFEDGKWYAVTGTVSRGTIAVSGEAHLILCDGAKLTCDGTKPNAFHCGEPGILLNDPHTLCVYGQAEGTGTLEALGALDCAGIGSGAGDSWTAGGLMVNGGVVLATGQDFGAGIGGSNTFWWKDYGNGGTVTVNGGQVRAIGGSDAAGIGGGAQGRGGVVTIRGGTVVSQGGQGGFGHGYGSGVSDSGTLTIDGGSVKAATIQNAPTNAANAAVWCVTVNVEKLNVEKLKVEGLGDYGTQDIFADEDGKVYLWLPNGKHEFTIDGVTYRAVVEDAAMTAAVYAELAPGEMYLCDTAEEATKVVKVAEFMPSAEVAAMFGENAEAKAAYCAKFEFGVVPTADGKWAVEAVLTPEAWTNVVLSAQDATLQLPVQRIAEWKTGDEPISVLLTNCVPGFYYSLFDGAAVTNIRAVQIEEDLNVLCGTDKKVVIPEVTKPIGGQNSGFFTIGVKETPDVGPSDRAELDPPAIIDVRTCGN